MKLVVLIFCEITAAGPDSFQPYSQKKNHKKFQTLGYNILVKQQRIFYSIEIKKRRIFVERENQMGWERSVIWFDKALLSNARIYFILYYLP